MYIETILKTLVLYIFIITAYRVMGKKEIGQLGVGDLIVTVLIAELAAISIEEEKMSILVSIIAISTLVIIDVLVNYISLKNGKIRYLIDGRPSIIIKNGKIRFNVMTKLRYTLDDLLSQLRIYGINNIEDVDYAILETNGKLSVFKNNINYPLPIILDGIIDFESLKEIKKDEFWLEKLLLKKNVKLDEIFYAFYKENKTFIIKKSDLI
ncbi:MAG: DUF421 domain-containing protein [Bacilli bacterium]